MQMDKLRKILQKMKPDEHKVIYTSPKRVRVTATKTCWISKNDFGVGLVSPRKDEFFPTHVRLLIDLYLKRISGSKKNVKELATAFEKIHLGEDPKKFIGLNKLRFPLSLDEPLVNLYYAQLLMIEQDFNYSKGAKSGKRGKPIIVSKYSPPHTFLMGFIRWALSDTVEVDRLITAAVRNYPPPRRYARPLR